MDTPPVEKRDVRHMSAVDYLTLLAEHYRLVLLQISVADSADDPAELASNALDDAGWLPHGELGIRQ